MRVYLKSGHRAEYAIEGTKEIHEFSIDRHLGLLRASREIYSETGATFYRMNVFFFNDYRVLARFRDLMKRAHWEALRAIAVSVPFVQIMHAPPEGGWTPKMCCPRPPIVRDLFLWRSDRITSKPWNSFSGMFSHLNTIIIYGKVTQAEAGYVLASAMSNERVEEMTFE